MTSSAMQPLTEEPAVALAALILTVQTLAIFSVISLAISLAAVHAEAAEPAMHP